MVQDEDVYGQGSQYSSLTPQLPDNAKNIYVVSTKLLGV